MHNRGRTFDVELELQDDIVLTASAVGTVAAAAKRIDLHTGGTVGFNMTGQNAVAETPMDLVVDVSALTINDNDEIYSFILEGSSSSTFASDIVQLAVLNLGANEVLIGGADGDSVVGRYILPVSNVLVQQGYQHIRLNTIIDGTTPSISFSAFLGKRGI